MGPSVLSGRPGTSCCVPDPDSRPLRAARFVPLSLDGHESARARGKAIGGAAVTDDAMLAVALHLRSQELSLRDIAARLVISTGKKNGQHPVTGHPDAHAPRARREDHSALPGLAGPSGVRPGRRDGGGRQAAGGRLSAPAQWLPLRWGELTALTTAQVDPAARVIAVDRKVVEVAGHLYLEPPKNRKYRRTVYPRRPPAGYPLA